MVADLTAADRDLTFRYGLRSIEGGRHPGWGTANRIVPLRDAYLELVTVVDEDVSLGSAFGRWVAAGAVDGGGPLGWAVRTRELDSIAQRLALSVHAGSRQAPGGELLRWRAAGIEESPAEPLFPFFIEWERGTPVPGRAAVAHPAGAVTLTRLELTGDSDRLTAWLGEHRLPISVSAGASGVARIVLAGSAGKIVLE